MNLLLSAISNITSLPSGGIEGGFLYIIWNPNLSIGPFRWYSLCWLIGLALAYFIVRHLFERRKWRTSLTRSSSIAS